tara:strand:- start:178 stop:936 length:759 start_codon:yes stop_codon:yes gene_type:complete
MDYKIYKNCITPKSSKDLFKFVLKNCSFYCPSLFNNKDNYKNTWIDKKFISRMKIFRKKYKSNFSSMYKAIQVSNEFKKMIYKNNLDLIAKNFLKVKANDLIVHGLVLRMDFPDDTRNSYGWHQDSAYDKFNLSSENGVILWTPLIDTNPENGTLVIKPGSQYSTFKCSETVSKGKKYHSRQILVKDKFVKKFPSKSVSVKKNCSLATYSGIFHKSGINTSDQIRFAILVRFNNQFSKDFLYFRNRKSGATR